jgi:hypothetical protein
VGRTILVYCKREEFRVYISPGISEIKVKTDCTSAEIEHDRFLPWLSRFISVFMVSVTFDVV